MEKRNKPCPVREKDKVLCIKDYISFKKDNTYEVFDVVDDYVQVEGSWLKKIEYLHGLLEAYKIAEPIVQKTLDNLLPAHVNESYFEDIFVSQKVLRKRKLKEIEKNVK